jgi:threonine aldolase
MAGRLRAAIDAVPGVTPTQPTDVNAVFAVLPPAVADRLRSRFHFYDWDARTHEVRWMCAFDTTDDDVDAFADAIATEMSILDDSGAHR